jgi:hypothetical protein
MAIHVVSSLRPVLFGSMLLLMSSACRRAERSDAVDTTAPQDTTSSQNAPAPAEYPSSMESERQERQERLYVTGRDGEEPLDVNDELQPGGGAMAGSAGTSSIDMD